MFHMKHLPQPCMATASLQTEAAELFAAYCLHFSKRRLTP